MTKDEREALIERLQAENAESVAHIAEREGERESNPAAMQDWLLADKRVTGGPKSYGEPMGAPPVQKSNGNDLVYRTTANGAQATAARPDTAAIYSHDDSDALAQAMAEVIVETRRELRHEMQREVAILRNENAELRGMLGAVLTMLGKSANFSDSKTDDVVDLPRGFIRRVHNNG